ncbi:hypothetical protein ABPG72_003706 [Tetrahymena utriculariae]
MKRKDSSDSDEDPRLAYKKAQKKQTQDQPNPGMEIAQKTITKNMFEKRGLQFSEDELKSMGSASQQTTNQKKQGAYIAGGGKASFEELKKELEISIKKKDDKTTGVILKYILEKDLEPSIKQKYCIQRAQLLLQMKQYQDCVQETEEWIQKYRQRDVNTQKFSVNMRLILAQAKSHLGEVWSGYLEFLRAEGFCQAFIQQKQQETQGEGKAKGSKSEQDINWAESDSDLLLKELQDCELHFKVKLQQEKKTVNFLYCSGFSNTGCLGLEGATSTKISLIPQIKNRQVLSIACGDHHTIALVKSFPSSLLFYPNYGQISNTFEHSYEVFGWGENTCGQITGDSSYNKIIEKPLLLSYFSGKFINAVGAHKASSLAIDLNGAVYEWGTNKFNNSESLGFEQTFQINQKEVVQISRGANFYAVLDTNKQCYWWGSLKDKLQKKDIQSTKYNNITSIAVGNNHMIISDENGKVYGLGDNSKGQLALGYKNQFVNQFEQIEQLKGSKVVKVRAFSDASLFFTDDGVLFYTGQISASKSIDYVKETEFSDDVKIVNGCGYDGQLYALSSSGTVYVWEPETSVKFKLHKDVTQQTFRDIFVGFGFQIMTKSLPNPKLCNIIIEKNQKFETYEDIVLQVVLRDQTGYWGLKPFYPLRYQLLVSDKKNLSIDEVERLAQNFTNMNKNQYQEEKLYIDEIGTQQLLQFIVQANNNQPHVNDITINIENAGVYYLYVLLSEEMIGTQPIELRIQQSKLEKLKREEQAADEEKRRNAALDKQRREEEKRQKLQDLLDEEKRQLELNEQKKKETDERAREAYQKYLKEQQEKKMKEEDERKRRAELQTGGGFDLEKANLYKKQSSTIQQGGQQQIQKQSSKEINANTNSQLGSSQTKIPSSKNSFTSFEKEQKPQQQNATTGVNPVKRVSTSNQNTGIGATKPNAAQSTLQNKQAASNVIGAQKTFTKAPVKKK